MNIVILSRNPNLYSTKRLIDEAELRNHDVEVIDPLKCDIIIEKEKPSIYYKDRYLDDVDYAKFNNRNNVTHKQTLIGEL